MARGLIANRTGRLVWGWMLSGSWTKVVLPPWQSGLPSYRQAVTLYSLPAGLSGIPHVDFKRVFGVSGICSLRQITLAVVFRTGLSLFPIDRQGSNLRVKSTKREKAE